MFRSKVTYIYIYSQSWTTGFSSSFIYHLFIFHTLLIRFFSSIHFLFPFLNILFQTFTLLISIVLIIFFIMLTWIHTDLFIYFFLYTIPCMISCLTFKFIAFISMVLTFSLRLLYISIKFQVLVICPSPVSLGIISQLWFSHKSNKFGDVGRVSEFRNTYTAQLNTTHHTTSLLVSSVHNILSYS